MSATIRVTGTQGPSYLRGRPRAFYVEAFGPRRRPLTFPRTIKVLGDPV